ncbi:DUF2726 domain-containing protein [Thiomonas sp.]|uniref:DUF2726 domain-containing protein n=1 Tax=Thiomonas sp. TaxID=2047785 RepID=UPI002623A9EB|nr:DUF2726 domain-containing protein [Thiomonas sp.]
MTRSATNATTHGLEHLRGLIARPNFPHFRDQFDRLVGSLSGSDRLPTAVAQLGAEAFEAFLGNGALEDPETLAWFVQLANRGLIDLTPGLSNALRRAHRRLTQSVERRRHGKLHEVREVVQLKRVVQLSWFGVAGFEASDAFEIRRSVFRSPQERAFARALSLRFPGLVALPNYPFDQIANLDRLKAHVSPEAWKYGRMCRLDAVLVTPLEGDPIAAFELDSRGHDRPEAARRDKHKSDLLMAARIPLLRLRSDAPMATAVDEWYSILTDEVLEKIDCGERVRVRDTHASLVPIYA